jgi:hypothetical protein
LRDSSYDNAGVEALRLVSGLIDRYGPRLSGTESCRAAAEELEGRLSAVCDEVHLESFDLHPGSLFVVGKVFALSYSVGCLSLFLPRPGISAAVGLLALLLGAAFCLAQFVLYLDVFDPLFRKIAGRNIVGRIEPSGPATKQILIVAHHDSAPIYPFHERLAALFPLRLFAPIALYALLLLACFAAFLAALVGGAAIMPLWGKIAFALGLAFVTPMYGYFSKRGSPGAGDNLSGCAICARIAGLFGGDSPRLGRTRLRVLLSDGEEAGQKGSMRFAREHLEEMRSLPTTVINIDTVYRVEDLGLLERDRNGMTPLSAELARRLQAIAAERGRAMRILSIPFGGGGTDGAQFARAGIETASVIGMPTAATRKEILIHTTRDLPDRIEAEALGAVIETVSEYIAREDGYY